MVLSKAIHAAHCYSSTSNINFSKTHSVPIIGPRNHQTSMLRTKEIESSNLLLAKRLETIHKKTSTLNNYKRLPDLKANSSNHFAPNSSNLMTQTTVQDSGYSMELLSLVPDATVKVVWKCLDTKKTIAEWLEHLQEGQTVVRKLPFKEFRESESICFEVEAVGFGKSILI